MNSSYDNNAAVVVLPPVSGGRLQDKTLNAWLAQSDLTDEQGPKELLARIIQEVGLPYPETGFGALRMWGQTGDRPANWIAAADPIYLEPRLDHLLLHALRPVGESAGDMRELLDHLQELLAVDKHMGFTRLGSYGYVSAKSHFRTAAMPAYVVDQQRPEEFLPSGDDTANHRNLLGEIEMALHDHPVNLARESNGKLPINSLWLWGGGTAPEQITRPQPPLFSDNALLTGYWYSRTGVAEPWPGNIASCIEQSVAGFVAVTPEFDENSAQLESWLHELREALRQGRLSSLTLLFRDGLRAHVQKSHAVRVWRRGSRLLDVAGR
jgi:hypothetical protein